jgi:hypothetical protein
VDGGLMELLTAQKWLKNAVGTRNKWRAEAKKSYDFVAGEQWSPEERQVMEDLMRPVTVFNRVAPIVDAIVGHETANRQAVAYLPRQLGASAVAEVISAAAKWVRDECGAEGEESDAFADAVITGEGWTDTRIEYDEDPDGRIIIERIDPREMDIDPAATKKNYADARWVCRTRRLNRERAQELWPDANLEDFSPSNRQNDTGDPIDVIGAAFYHLDSGAEGRVGAERDMVLVHDFQWWEYEPIYRVPGQQLAMVPGLLEALHQSMPDVHPSETGLVTFTEAQWKAVAPSVAGIKPIEQRRRVYKRMFWSGSTVLEGPKPTPVDTSFTYKAITAKRDHQKHCWYGIVRAMRDPQLWSNKFMSLALEIIATSAKGGVFAEISAFQDPRKAEDDFADPSKIVYVKEGALSGPSPKIMPRPTTQPPANMQELMMYANQSLQDAAGVNPAVMGFSKELDVSGVLEQTRQQAGLNLLSYLFDALRRYHKEQGKLLMAMMREYIPQGRLVKIDGPSGAQYAPLAFDKSIDEYDIVVDEAPTAPNVKQQTWEALEALGRMMGPAASVIFSNPAFLLAALKYAPLPQALVQEWAKAASNPQAQQQHAMQAQLQAGAILSKTREQNAAAALKEAQAQHVGESDPNKVAAEQIGLLGDVVKAKAEMASAQAKAHQTHLDTQSKLLHHHLDAQAAIRDANLDAERAAREAALTPTAPPTPQ